MRAASALAVAFGLGLALGLILTSPAGIGGGQYWIFVIVATCTYIGWLAAQLSATLVSLVAGPVLVLVMTAALFGVKLVRLPDAPLTGDGIEVLVAIYAGFGVLGAVIGRLPWLRAPATTIARISLWIAAAAVAVTAVPLALTP